MSLLVLHGLQRVCQDMIRPVCVCSALVYAELTKKGNFLVGGLGSAEAFKGAVLSW